MALLPGGFALAATLAGCLKGEPGEAAAVPGDRRLADYHMPLESGPHERTIMQWPVSLEVYDPPALSAVQDKIALIANTISGFEPVAMLASGSAATTL